MHDDQSIGPPPGGTDQSGGLVSRPETDDTSEARGQGEVLADAVRVLTEAARLRRRTMRRAADGGWEADPSRTEPADWAEFITLAVAGAAANIGSIEKALQGRPGSWEADAVRGMLVSTVGENPAELMRHRTEPLRVVLRPEEILSDLGYAELYDESRRALRAQQDRHVWQYQLSEDRTWTPLTPDAPAYADALTAYAGEWDVTEVPAGYTPGTVMTVPRSAVDEAAYEALEDQDLALEDLASDGDPRVYGEALTATVLAEAARVYPGIPVEVTVDIDGQIPADDSMYWAPEDGLMDIAVEQTPLPWSGIAPGDYPPGQSIADAERAAGRLPHLRLDSQPAPRTEPGQ
jgi:hypothetical protein